MGIYRLQATSVGYWRGQAKRWQNTFHYSISSDTIAASVLPDAITKINALGTNSMPGGLASVAIYNQATGGVPIAETIRFPWATPASWLPWSGAGPWTTGALQPNATEAAARFRTQAGLSRTGKPVYVGIYWHAFLASTAEATGVQFGSTVVTAASALYNALQTLSAGGSAVAVQVTPTGNPLASSGTLLPYVESHQRVRGRRRASVTIDGVKYYKGATVKAPSGPLIAD